MAAFEDLFHLIESLSSAEKRRFKLQIKLQNGTKQYAELFSVIEKKIKRKNQTKKIGLKDLQKDCRSIFGPSKLNQLQIYLEERILQSLRATETTPTEEDKISIIFSDARTLEQKGLYIHCLKKIQTIKKISINFEMYAQLVEVLDMERYLQARIGNKGVVEHLSELGDQLKHFQNLNNNTLKYNHLQNIILALYRKENRARSIEDNNLINRLIKLPDLQNVSLAITFKAKIGFYFSNALLRIMISENHQALDFNNKLYKIWKNNEHFQKKYLNAYLIHLSNYLVTCHNNNSYREFPEILNEIKQIKPRSFYESAEKFQNLLYLEQLQFINITMYSESFNYKEESSRLSKEIWEGLSLYGDKVILSRRIALTYNSGLMLFILSEFDQALTFVSSIRQINTDQRKGLTLFSKLFELILHFELKNYLFIQNSYRSYRNNLKEKKIDFEGIVFSNLYKIVKTPGRRVKLFQDFKQNVSEFRNSKVPFFDEIDLWLEYKITNKPMYLIMKDRLGNNEGDQE